MNTTKRPKKAKLDAARQSKERVDEILSHGPSIRIAHEFALIVRNAAFFPLQQSVESGLLQFYRHRSKRT
jgi:hypothetical protein